MSSLNLHALYHPHPERVCMTPKTWFWFLVLVILLYWCLHRSSQEFVAHHVGRQATRMKQAWFKTMCSQACAVLPASSSSNVSPSNPTYAPTLTMDAVRTPGGLLKRSEGLTDQHWCSTRKGGCLKDIKGTPGTPSVSTTSREGFLRSSSIYGQVNQYNRNGWTGTDAYEDPDADSQYTQWTHSSWNEKNGVPAFTVSGSPFYGDPSVGASTYWKPDPVVNAVWPGNDVGQVFPDNLELKRSKK